MKKKGFTLVELLVVMGLLGFLISAVGFTASTQLKKARDASRKADLEIIKIALYDYYFDHDCFPQALPACHEVLGKADSPYLGDFPCDPIGSPYGYQVAEGECSQWFKILTNLENTRDSDIDKVGCRGGCGPDCNFNFGLASTNVQLNEGCPLEGPPEEECFIATVVYETPSASEVEILKEFRNEVLLKSSFGRILVTAYYQNSPPLADLIAQHPQLKEMVRKFGLEPMVMILKAF